MTEPHPFDHYRTGGDDSVPAGVYRVVGTGDPVTLLRVTDASGTRENTGEVVTVAHEVLVDRFEDAENPDAGFSVGDLLAPVRTWAVAIPYWIRNLLR